MTRVDHSQVVGTAAGYMWHRRRGEQACDPCLDGYRRHRQDYRDAQQAEPHVVVSLPLLGRILDALPTETRIPLAAELGHGVARRAYAAADRVCPTSAPSSPSESPDTGT